MPIKLSIFPILLNFANPSPFCHAAFCENILRFNYALSEVSLKEILEPFIEQTTEADQEESKERFRKSRNNLSNKINSRFTHVTRKPEELPELFIYGAEKAMDLFRSNPQKRIDRLTSNFSAVKFHIVLKGPQQIEAFLLATENEKSRVLKPELVSFTHAAVLSIWIGIGYLIDRQIPGIINTPIGGYIYGGSGLGIYGYMIRSHIYNIGRLNEDFGLTHIQNVVENKRSLNEAKFVYFYRTFLKNKIDILFTQKMGEPVMDIVVR
jgi:hypothetical protein